MAGVSQQTALACAMVALALGISGCSKKVSAPPPCTPPKATRGCPMAVNTGAVGSCMMSSCSASRGPTYCAHGSCYCQEGYCRYPASTVHIQSRRCRALVPDSTCHLTRSCWKGGLLSSSCVKGSCMCRSGYHIDCQGKCAKGWAPLVMDAVGGNATEVSAAEEEDDREEGLEVAANVAVAAMWAGAAAALLAGSAVFAVRKLRRSPDPEHAEYEKLPDGAKFLVA